VKEFASCKSYNHRRAEIVRLLKRAAQDKISPYNHPEPDDELKWL
jgi:hypothetical protein